MNGSVRKTGVGGKRNARTDFNLASAASAAAERGASLGPEDDVDEPGTSADPSTL
jgi:hypothetical protein